MLGGVGSKTCGVPGGGGQDLDGHGVDKPGAWSVWGSDQVCRLVDGKQRGHHLLDDRGTEGLLIRGRGDKGVQVIADRQRSGGPRLVDLKLARALLGRRRLGCKARRAKTRSGLYEGCSADEERWQHL